MEINNLILELEQGKVGDDYCKYTITSQNKRLIAYAEVKTRSFSFKTRNIIYEANRYDVETWREGIKKRFVGSSPNPEDTEQIVYWQLRRKMGEELAKRKGVSLENEVNWEFLKD